MLGWLLVERIKDGHATTLGGASGAVAGLVAITPCAGFVGGMAPIYIGLIAGAVCYLALGIKKAFGFDDSLDVVAVHLVGGLAGALLLGLFADSAINPRWCTRGCSWAAASPCWATRRWRRWSRSPTRSSSA